MTGGSDAVSLTELPLREVQLTSKQPLVHQTETQVLMKRFFFLSDAFPHMITTAKTQSITNHPQAGCLMPGLTRFAVRSNSTIYPF